jgi:hypothetical protein
LALTLPLTAPADDPPPEGAVGLSDPPQASLMVMTTPANRTLIAAVVNSRLSS